MAHDRREELKWGNTRRETHGPAPRHNILLLDVRSCCSDSWLHSFMCVGIAPRGFMVASWWLHGGFMVASWWLHGPKVRKGFLHGTLCQATEAVPSRGSPSGPAPTAEGCYGHIARPPICICIYIYIYIYVVQVHIYKVKYYIRCACYN